MRVHMFGLRARGVRGLLAAKVPLPPGSSRLSELARRPMGLPPRKPGLVAVDIMTKQESVPVTSMAQLSCLALSQRFVSGEESKT
jgi:hypothetical protein